MVKTEWEYAYDKSQPNEGPMAIGGISRPELYKEIKKGIDSLETGTLFSVDDVDQELARKFGI